MRRVVPQDDESLSWEDRASGPGHRDGRPGGERRQRNRITRERTRLRNWTEASAGDFNSQGLAEAGGDDDGADPV